MMKHDDDNADLTNDHNDYFTCAFLDQSYLAHCTCCQIWNKKDLIKNLYPKPHESASWKRSYVQEIRFDLGKSKKPVEIELLDELLRKGDPSEGKIC